MKRKVLWFCLLVIAAVFIIRNLVYAAYLHMEPFSRLSKDGEKLVEDGLVIAGCLIVAVKYRLVYTGGFKGGHSNYYWMFVLPLIFPGAIMLSAFDTTCFAATLSFATYLVAILIRGLLEECVFRGVIQGYVIRHNATRSVHSTCLLTATLFSLVHLSNLRYYEGVGVAQQLVFAFFLGLLFSAIQFWMNNVWLSGLAHGMINLFGSNICNPDILADETQKSLLADYLTGIGTALLIMSPVILVYWLLIRSYKQQQKTFQEKR